MSRGEQCKVEDCEKTSTPTSSMCSMHKARLWRTGTTDPSQYSLPAEQRFWLRVEKTDSCWNWTGTRHSAGYGVLGRAYAHRLSWELHRGPIPSGLHIDHKCHNRLCVNPDHLQVVTLEQNNQNHNGPRRNNRSGYRGVSWSKAMKKWQAVAEHHGVVERAYFDRVEDAAAAAVEMRNRLHSNNLKDRVA